MLPHAWHTTPAAFSNRPRLRASRIQRLVIELSFFLGGGWLRGEGGGEGGVSGSAGGGGFRTRFRGGFGR